MGVGARISRGGAIATAAGLAVAAGLGATPSWAQDTIGSLYRQARPGPPTNPDALSGNPDRDASRNTINFRNVTPSRLPTLERREFNAIDAERRRARLDDDALKADIAEQLRNAGVACDVRAFRRVGMSEASTSIYEAVCGDGPGYVLVNGVEPSAKSCIVLAGAAAGSRRRDPAAPAGAQCVLPENQNGRQIIGGWAREAGITCKVDDAAWLGASEDGLDTYEVGCEGSEGYWLEKAASGWVLRPCLQVSAEGLTCRFTEAGEQFAWMRTRLAGTAASDCDVMQVRMIGTSAQGNHYEARCSAPGQGFVLRIAGEGRAEDVTACEDVGGGATACALAYHELESEG